MWLVSGIDEEHRFPDWTDAAQFYRQIVADWVAAHGDADQSVAVHELRPGSSQEVEFAAADGNGEKVRFRLEWETHGGRMDHFVAC
jgi:uncharacterized protein YndB with AHSA1/START domain